MSNAEREKFGYPWHCSLTKEVECIIVPPSSVKSCGPWIWTAMSAAPAMSAVLSFQPPMSTPTFTIARLASPTIAHPIALRRFRIHRCSALLPPAAEIAPAASAAYGAVLVGGGLLAYVRSGSKGSIFGGLSGSALMAIAYYLMQSPETYELGHSIGFGSAFLFASVFGIRLYNTRKLVPSGLLLSISIAAMAVFFFAYMQDKVPLVDTMVDKVPLVDTIA